MSSKHCGATARLRQDYMRLKKDPLPYIIAEPNPSNILEWFYVVIGPENTQYEGGMYLGKLVFPRDFPYKPPSIYMVTPNGRFKTNTRLCLSMSDFHPDTWNPAWSVSTILTGLLSFMVERSPTLGSIEMSDYERRQLAARSLRFNLNDKNFCELFPDLVKGIEQELERRAQEELNNRRTSNSRSGLANSLTEHLEQQSPMNGAMTNVCFIVGVIVFAFVVKCVLKSIDLPTE